MQSLLPHLPMEAQPAPPPPAPDPIPKGDAEVLPQPPCFMELVKQAAEKALPSKACTPMLLQRTNMLLQDVVEAACMCMRAHVDSPLLLKHHGAGVHRPPPPRSVRRKEKQRRRRRQKPDD